MKKILLLAAIVMIGYTYLLITACIAYFTEIPEVAEKYVENWPPMALIFSAAIVLIPAHFILVYRAYKKHNLDIAYAVPYLVLPYMLGATLQAMVL